MERLKAIRKFTENEIDSFFLWDSIPIAGKPWQLMQRETETPVGRDFVLPVHRAIMSLIKALRKESL